MSTPSHRNRHSIRIPGYDYTFPGGYFITLLSYRRTPRFSDVKEGKILLTSVGELLNHEWLKLPLRFPNIELDAFAIMPDHMHGILLFHDGDRSSQTRTGESRGFSDPRPHVASGSLGAIIRSFKSTASRLYHFQRNTDGQPLWQRNYYEHVIRDEEDLLRIREYILSNPLNWPKESPSS